MDEQVKEVRSNVAYLFCQILPFSFKSISESDIAFLEITVVILLHYSHCSVTYKTTLALSRLAINRSESTHSFRCKIYSNDANLLQ